MPGTVLESVNPACKFLTPMVQQLSLISIIVYIENYSWDHAAWTSLPSLPTEQPD